QLLLASVVEGESAAARQEVAIAGAVAQVAAALRDGNREEWLYAEAQAVVAGWNRGRVAPILEMRRVPVGPAPAAFLERGREREQVEELIRRRRLEQEVEGDRKVQAQLDEWFLGQRRRGTKVGF